MDWEYSVVTEESWVELDATRAGLRRAGEEGWELMSAVYNPERAGMMYFFKRPLRRPQADADAPAEEPWSTGSAL